MVTGGDCVTDNLTGLMWAKDGDLPNGTRSWQGALDFVASLNNLGGLCGYYDWRLPNINEIESLVNAGEADPGIWLNGQGFNNVQTSHYWSSTTPSYDRFGSDDVWDLDMEYGKVMYYPKDHAGHVWPVRSTSLGQSAPVWKTGQTISCAAGDDGDLERGVAWPTERVTDHGDETVTDNLTGLMWAKGGDLPHGTRSWQGALDYVKSINNGYGLSGYHDWRLPNRKEILSLIDRSRSSPALPTGHPFQNFQSYNCWSSTTLASNTDYAWYVDMWFGSVNYEGKPNHYYVWPVRAGTLYHPEISITPNSVPFGSVNVGSTLDQSITVTNDGGANLSLGTITSPSLPFSTISDDCSGQTFSPGAHCTVTYRFSPTSPGSFSSYSNIPSNDPNENPVAVYLSGIGVPQTAHIWVTPTAYDFGNVKVKKKKAASFKVGNEGTVDLSVSISITGKDVSMFRITGSSISRTIKPNKSLTVKVTFKPTSADPKEATLEISSDDPDAPTIEIPLGGIGQ